jgi:hypothetical protein
MLLPPVRWGLHPPTVPISETQNCGQLEPQPRVYLTKEARYQVSRYTLIRS